ncbi:CHAT domain-containing protein [Sulfidibacter corallicola]|uniref:CHAT domain-containing protein n=1 Tax=Sulfidibacter corallicola TaxID=2818388 RepID=A0A8A4TJ80_SULCO|nr:CHAT domain-containing tetratricopeptide repeat protein [Sulfidibacter corallicola]QTD48858.1 CHAT domain-containing protein [Sulfidibacter corallicola]
MSDRQPIRRVSCACTNHVRWLGLAWLFALAHLWAETPEPVEIPVRLQEDRYAESGTLKQGERRSLRVAGNKGDLFEVRITQEGVDLKFTLLGSGGETILSSDKSLVGEHGDEWYCFQAEGGGNLSLVLECKARVGGSPRYHLELLRKLAPEPSDRARAEICRTLFGTGTASPDKQALKGARARATKIKDDYLQGVAEWMMSDLARRNQPENALRHADRAVAAFERAGFFDHAVALASNVGRWQQSRCLPSNAGRFHKLALELAAKAHPYRAAVVQNNYGVFLQRGGDLSAAIEAYRKALAAYEALPMPEASQRTLLNLAGTLMAAKRPEDARDALHHAGEHMEEPPVTQRARDLKAEWFMLSGWADLQDGNLEEAVKKIREARSIEPLTPWVRALCDDRLGTALRMFGQYDEALEAHTRALDYYRSQGFLKAVAAIQLNLAWVHMSRGDHGKSDTLIKSALAVLEQGCDASDQVDGFKLMAQVQMAKADHAAAEPWFDRMLGAIESDRVSLYNPRLARTLSDARQEYFETYVDYLIDQAERDPKRAEALRIKAIQVLDRNRARALNQSYRHRMGLGPWRDQESSEMRTLQRKVEALAEVPLEDLPFEEKSAVERERRELLLQINELRDEKAQSQNPLGEPTVTLEAVRANLLDRETAVLIYQLGDRRSHAWVITHDNLFHVVLPPRQKIERAAQQWSKFLNQRNLASQRIRKALRAKTLTERILQPVWPYLAKKRRVLLMADGSLHLVPFAALPIPGDGQHSDVDESAVTLERLAWVRIPSLSFSLVQHEVMAQGAGTAAETIAIFCDPVNSPRDERLKLMIPRESRHESRSSQNLARLVHSAELCRQMRDWFPMKGVALYQGFDANREQFFKANLARYRMIHFSAHAVLHDREPELSHIELSGYDVQGRPRDSALRLGTLFDMYLPGNELTVISSCKMASGEVFRGEGVFSLCSSLLATGSRRVIAGLWSVDNESSERLMAHFYQNLSTGKLSAVEALRLAQLEVRKVPKWRDPHYWSGFVFTGSTKSFSINR